MADRPIIFSAPMIAALLAGRKTQTRRKAWGDPVTNRRGFVTGLRATEWQKTRPGDRLWVREAWCPGYSHDPDALDGVPKCSIIYRADLSEEMRAAPSYEFAEDWHARYAEDGPGNPINKPSIYMPRWASRLTLTVTEVRRQRLQEISEEDARAEGLAAITKDGKLVKYGIPDRDGLPGTDNIGWPWCRWCVSPRLAFCQLWTDLHGDDAWDANPEIVAVSFRCERRNIDAREAA